MNTVADSRVDTNSQTTIPPLRRLRFAFSALASLGVAACGGGGEDPALTVTPTTAPAAAGTPAAPAPAAPAPAPAAPAPAVPAPAPSAAGLDGVWIALTPSQSGFPGTLRYVLVDTTGQFWGIPSITFGTNGASVNPLEAEKGVISNVASNVSGSFYDINTTTCGLYYSCQVSGLLSSSQLTIAGSKILSGTALPDFSFSGTRDPAYATQAALSSIAGTWDTRASLRTSLNSSGSMVIGSTGALTVNNIGGCAFNGQLNPVQGKGYFKLSLTTVSGTCSAGVVPSQVNGVAYTVKDSTGRTYLNLMWHNTGYSQYFWGTGAGVLL